jgi:hypothetical protein
MSAARAFPLVLLALAVVAAGQAPARAQCRLCETPTTAPEQAEKDSPIELQIESSLDFDRLILVGEGAGAAVIRPDGSNSQQGSVTIGPRAMVGSASIHGTPGRVVRVELPRRIELYSTDGGRISVDEVFSDLPSLPRLDSAGNLSFRFGGRIRINGDSEGQYRGDMPITVEYM